MCGISIEYIFPRHDKFRIGGLLENWNFEWRNSYRHESNLSYQDSVPPATKSREHTEGKLIGGLTYFPAIDMKHLANEEFGTHLILNRAPSALKALESLVVPQSQAHACRLPV